ncbi:MAG: hypothetical protein K6G12_07100 [Lachnospiraceae bacterium]|nr:hypothetical protein [Lachnospiraceae bacterium]
MRTGVLPSNIYDRAVYKPVHKYNKDRGTVCETACASSYSSKPFYPVCVYAELSGLTENLSGEIEVYMLHFVGQCMEKNLRIPDSVIVGVTMPETFEEPMLRSFISFLTKVCGKWELGIKDVFVRTSAAVNRIQFVFTASYDISTEDISNTADISVTAKSNSYDGFDLVITGYAGAFGGRLLTERNLSSLSQRFSINYLDKARTVACGDRCDMLNILDVISTQAATDRPRIFSAGEGGIYAALWNLGESLGCGMNVYQKKIPVYQETIEICNHLDVDPYKLESAGCLVFAVSDGPEFCKALEQKGIDSSHIGCLTRDLKRVIINGGEERFLNLPDMDELYRKKDD